MRLSPALLLASTLIFAGAAHADPITYTISGTLNTDTSVTVNGMTTINTGNTNPGFLSIYLNFSNGTSQTGIGTDGQDFTHNVYVGLANDLFSLSDPIQNLNAAGTKFNLSDASGKYVGGVFNGVLTAATPEPSSFALLGTGLLGGFAVLRRRYT